MQEEKTDRERRKMNVPLSLFAGGNARAPPGLLLQGFRAAAAWRQRRFKNTLLHRWNLISSNKKDSLISNRMV